MIWIILIMNVMRLFPLQLYNSLNISSNVVFYLVDSVINVGMCGVFQCSWNEIVKSEFPFFHFFW